MPENSENEEQFTLENYVPVMSESMQDTSAFSKFVSDSVITGTESPVCLELVSCFLVVLAVRFVKELISSLIRR